MRKDGHAFTLDVLKQKGPRRSSESQPAEALSPEWLNNETIRMLTCNIGLLRVLGAHFGWRTSFKWTWRFCSGDLRDEREGFNGWLH
jgi:hypothetical protein